MEIFKVLFPLPPVRERQRNKPREGDSFREESGKRLEG